MKSPIQKNICDKIRLFKNSREEKTLLGYLKEVHDIGKNYETAYSYFEPQGTDGKSYDEEFDSYLRKRKGLRKVAEPVFVYPGIEGLDIAKFEKSFKQLERTEEKAKKEKNEHIRNVVLKTLDNLKAKLFILFELKLADKDGAFYYAKYAYGDVDDHLFKEAEKCYAERLKYFKRMKRKRKSKLEEYLLSLAFDSEDIKKYFDLTLDICGFKDAGFKAVVDNRIMSVNTRFSAPGFACPVISIPPDKKVNGVELFELVAHEVCGHAALDFLNAKLGFRGLCTGEGWEIFHEGVAIRNEVKIKKDILGKSFISPKIKSKPYSVLAIEKIKEGFAVGEVYDYIYGLKKKEFFAGGYSDSKSDAEASKETKSVLRRVIRGMYPHYFPKDKAYLQGELMVLDMENKKSTAYWKKQYNLESGLVDILYFLKSRAEEKVSMVEKILLETICEGKDLKI